MPSHLITRPENSSFRLRCTRRSRARTCELLRCCGRTRSVNRVPTCINAVLRARRTVFVYRLYESVTRNRYYDWQFIIRGGRFSKSLRLADAWYVVERRPRSNNSEEHIRSWLWRSQTARRLRRRSRNIVHGWWRFRVPLNVSAGWTRMEINRARGFRGGGSTVFW